MHFTLRMLGALCAMSIATASLTTGSARADGGIEEIVKRGELVVAVQTQGPPNSFVDRNGERVGLAIDMVKAMAKDMGVGLKIVDFDFKGLIPAAVSGKVDFIAADMAPKSERALVLTFTEPYYESPVVLYAKRTKGFTRIDELNKAGVKLGVVTGSSNKPLLESHFPKATIMEFAGGGPALAQAVADDRVDAVANDISAAKANMAKYGEDFMILDGNLYLWPESFGVRPEKYHLIAWLNNWIGWAKRDGKMQQWIEYWRLGDQWRKDHM